MRWLLLLGLVTLAVVKPMAIRERSSRRDNPVMVRLLQQIVAANGKETEAFQPAARRRRLIVSCPTVPTEGEECKLSEQECNLPFGTPCPRECGATLKVVKPANYKGPDPVSTIPQLREVFFRNCEVCKDCRKTGKYVLKPSGAERKGPCPQCTKTSRMKGQWKNDRKYYCKTMAMNSYWIEESADRLFNALAANVEAGLQMKEIKPVFFKVIFPRGSSAVTEGLTERVPFMDDLLEEVFRVQMLPYSSHKGHATPGVDMFNLAVALRNAFLFSSVGKKRYKGPVEAISKQFNEARQIDYSAFPPCE